MNEDLLFWDKIRIPADVMTGCWEWTSGKVQGYGYIQYRHFDGKQQKIRAHRWVYEYVKGLNPGKHRTRSPLSESELLQPQPSRTGEPHSKRASRGFHQTG